MAARRKKNGRPTKFTAELADEILRAVRLGQPQEVAAQRAGIDPKTLRNWKARGREKPDSEHGTFYRALQRADAQAEAHLGAKTYEKALEDGRLGLAYMAVRWPRRWGQKQQLEVAGKKGAPIETFDVVSAGLLSKLKRMEALGKGEQPPPEDAP